MASKPKKPAAPKAEKFPRKNVQLPVHETDSEETIARKHARLVLSPELAAYRAILATEGEAGLSTTDIPSLIDGLRDQAAKANVGELSHAEAMLMNQATVLQSLFARLTERGMAQAHMPNLEGFMRMALRAQSQCRATLETLAAIKNPPIVYARQANVTTGPQQINNGTVAPTRAREIETEPTQLSGGTHELLPDARASGNAGRVNPALETVGEIDRAEVPRG